MGVSGEEYRNNEGMVRVQVWSDVVMGVVWKV